MASFESLKAWHAAHEVVLAVYRLSAELHEQDRFGVGSQMCRAAVSAAANLAEGRERESDRDFAHFATMSADSLGEVQYYLILLRDLGVVADSNIAPVVNLAAGALRLTKALRESLRKPPP